MTEYGIRIKDVNYIVTDEELDEIVSEEIAFTLMCKFVDGEVVEMYNN